MNPFLCFKRLLFLVIIYFYTKKKIALTDSLKRSTACSARCRLSVLRFLALLILSIASRWMLTFPTSTATAPAKQAPPVSSTAVRLSSSTPFRRCFTFSMVSHMPPPPPTSPRFEAELWHSHRLKSCMWTPGGFMASCKHRWVRLRCLTQLICLPI